MADNFITPEQKRLLEEKGWTIMEKHEGGLLNDRGWYCAFETWHKATTQVQVSQDVKVGRGDMRLLAEASSILGLLPKDEEMVLVPKEVARKAAECLIERADRSYRAASEWRAYGKEDEARKWSNEETICRGYGEALKVLANRGGV